MNRIYKVIWSKVKNQYVVVSELAHSNGKQSSTSKISSVRGSLRAMLAALMVAGGIFSFTPAVYAAQANETSVSILSDGIFWLQNGDNSIVIDEGNFDTYFVGAVRQADGTYTINGQVVSDKNLYNINDEIGAFVVDNNVYTGEVLDKDSHTVLSMQQRTIVNEDGFYAGNGKGTYNTLSKDGLWVGGTKDGEGFHVDNDGNVNTDGKFTATSQSGDVIINNGQVSTHNENGTASLSGDGLVMQDDQGSAYLGGGNLVLTGDIQANDGNFSGDLTVNGDTNLKDTNIDGNLGVTGDTTLAKTDITGDLGVSGNTTLAKTDITGDLGVSGDTTLAKTDITGDLGVSGDTTLAKTDITGDLGVTGDTTLTKTDITGDLGVTGDTTLAKTDITGDLGVTGDTTLAKTDITGALGVTGDTTLAKTDITGDLGVTGDTTLAKTDITGDLGVTGDTTLAKTDITGALGVTGNTILAKTDITGDLGVTGDTILTKTDITGDLGVTGDTTLAKTDITGDLGVSGDTTLAKTDITGDLGVTGNTTLAKTDITGDLGVTGNTALAKTDITGDLGVTGNTTISGTMSAGNITTSSVTGLTNKTLDVENFAKVGRAATEEQLKIVSDRVGNTDYTSNNYVDDNDSLTTATGKLDAAIKANADSITTLNAGWTAKDSSGKTIAVNSTNKELAFKGDNNVTVSADTTNRAIQVGLANTITIGSSGGTNHPIKIDGTEGEITGLTNTDWKPNEVTYDGSGKAATEGQLYDVYEAAVQDATGTTYTASDGVSVTDGTSATNKTIAVNAGKGLAFGTASEGETKPLEVKAGDGISVSDAGVAVNLSADSNLVLEGDVDGKKTLGLADNISLTKVTAKDGFYVTDGGGLTSGSFTSSGLTIGSTSLTSTGLTTQNVSGLTNTKWDDDTIKAVSEDTNRTGVASYAATQGQLKDVYDAIDNVQKTTYTEGNGVSIETGDNPTISVKAGDGLEFGDETTETKSLQVNANENKGIEVGTTEGVGVKLSVDNTDNSDDSNLEFGNNGGLKLKDNLTDLTSVTANEFKVGNETYISSAGINANSKKITNVANGDIEEDSKDAINGGQLYSKINEVKGSIKTYEAGDGISISGNNNTISVNADKTKGITVSDAGVAVNAGDGLTFTEGEVGQLKVATGNGITVDDGSVAIDLAENSNLTVDNGLSLAKELTDLTSIGTDTLTASGDVSAKNFVTTSGSVRAGSIVINENNSGKITGLTVNPTDDDDAVNKAYVDKYVDSTKGLAVQYDDITKSTVTLDKIGGVIVTNLKPDEWKSGSTSAATVGQVYDITGDAEWSSTKFINDVDDLTEAAKKLDEGIGNLDFSTNHAILGTTNYASATQAISELDRNIGDLTPQEPQSYFTKGAKLTSVTNALDRLSHAIGPMQFDTTNNFIDNDANLSSAIDKLDENIGNALKNVGFRLDQNGKVSTDIDWGTNYDSGTTIVSAVKDLDNRVDTLEGAANSINNLSASNISTLSALSNMDMSTANTLASISPNALKAVANLSAENAVVSDSEVMGSSAANSEPTRNPEPGDNYDGDFNVGGTLKVTDDATFDKNVNVGGKLDVKGEANFHEKATFDKDVSIGGTLEMNGNRITGLAAGKEDTDAVNVGQLNEVKQDVADNRTAINTMGNQVNRLSNRIDKVGAGAAALAALHPLDFDPDDKLSFAAGYGNYAGENAVAVGAFYQPNEDTMFSVGGTFGNDENMVNAGVSFKLGQKSNVSRSRVSMAKELVSLRDEVAQLKALMAHAGILPSNGQFDTSALFPDVPENHWAYEYVHELGRLGILEGYADGNFEGDRMMTRYEMAAIVYRAMQKGVNIDSRMLKEFEPELKLIRVDVVARDDDGNPTIERVRVNEDTQQA